MHVLHDVDRARAGAPDDAALLDGIARGDEASCRDFVQRHQRAVYGTALRVVRDPGLAEEVAQNAFVRVWQKAGSYDGGKGSVTTWLLTITRNLGIDELRRRRTEVVALDDDLDHPGGTAGPSDQVVARDDLRRVARTIGRLPDRQRRALLLATWHGRTAEQIAAHEGIPLGTAKDRVRSALLRVRAAHPDASRGGR